MTKIKLNQKFSPYQMPCVIIGTNVEGKSNFMLCTWVSRVNRNPPLWMVSINKKHYTIKGIKKNEAFSINFPSTDLLVKVDYIGITSGRATDKSLLFDIFYGDINVPMIKDCTLNIELKVKDLIELPDHFMIIGTAMNSYFDKTYQTNGIIDVKKSAPIIYFGIENNRSYWSIGEKLGDAFKLGREFNT